MAFFQTYQHVPFVKIYISALKRTFQTVSSFIDLSIPYEKHEGLNEISWGVMEGKVPNSFDNEYYRNLIESWTAGNTALRTDGGESPEQVKDRQQPVIELILSRPEEETILVAMHGRAMRILLSWIMNRSLSEMDQFEHSNLCLYKLIYDYSSQQFTIELNNDSTHLLTLSVSNY